MRLIEWISPVQAAFFGSLLLSIVAIVSNPTLNRDGILYVETARLFLQDGFAAAYASYNWPFLPLLLAVVSKLTGMGIENAGRAVNAIFMAGACAFLVACVRRRMPDDAWAVCLAVLALPGLNHYRSELLREYGCWFFMMLSFWLAIRWSEAPRWPTALIAQLALLGAALFRPEALVFFAAFGLWQVFSAPRDGRWARTLMITSVPLTGGVLGLALFVGGQFSVGGRLASLVDYVDPEKKRALFDLKAQALAAALQPYARNQAPTIVLLGSLALIPLKIAKQLGLFIVPLLFLLRTGNLRSVLGRVSLFAWALLAHSVVLATFVIDMQFLAGRYVAVIGLLAAPFIGAGLADLMRRFPRWKNALTIVALSFMVANVITLNPAQKHFVHAGQWLAANASENPRVYVQGSRTAYYAGWKVNWETAGYSRQKISEGIRQGKYELLALEVPASEIDIEAWLSANGLHVVQRFKGARNDSVVIATTTTARP